MTRQAMGARKPLMTSVSTYVAHLPSARSCVEMTGNNEMSSSGVARHKEAYRPDAGCILGGKIGLALRQKTPDINLFNFDALVVYVIILFDFFLCIICLSSHILARREP